MKMKTVYAHAPLDIKHYSTAQLREEFLMEKVFVEGDITLTYTHCDRLIFGGAVPTDKELEIVLNKELGVEYFLERRELGVINIGGKGVLTIDGQDNELENGDGFYIGKGTKHVLFKSLDKSNPAKFYMASAPAHHKYPSKKLALKDVTALEMGDNEHMNKRKIHQYIHPNIVESCQLQLGLTTLAVGSSWNTMPCHTHERRMEAYLYFDIPQDNVVFHLMGRPDETKHIVMKNEQAVISPSWSIHSGVGTSNYSFIWAMCGENITYTDMDMVQMNDLM